MPATISVIIPVYNGSRFILDALNSVCAQTYRPKEIVVADDCSTDNTREIVTEFARSAPVLVKLHKTSANTGGPYEPANQAFPLTTGDYVVVLDADDLFAPEAFETLLTAAELSSGANVGSVVPDFLTFRDGTGEVVCPSSFARFPNVLGRVIADRSPSGVVLEPEEALRASVDGALPFRGLIARSVWTALGGANLRFPHAGDSEFTWRLVSQTNFRLCLVNRPLNRVRLHGESMSANRVRESRQLVALYRAMLRHAPAGECRTRVQRRLRRELWDLAYNAYKARSLTTLVPALGALACQRVRRVLAG